MKPRRPLLWALGAAGLVLVGQRGFRRLLANALELRRLKREYASLQAQEAELSERIRKLKTSDAALEGAARRELGLRRPGEVEYRFTPPKDPAKKQ